MTDEEIRNMPAGREMDALIADRFNLYTLSPHFGDWFDVVRTETYTSSRYIRQFSTDIAAAWEVVEKMKPRHLYLSNIGVGWFCDFGMSAVYGEPTASLAISRAALLAVQDTR